MPWIAFRVIYRRLMRCGINTCLKVLSGVGGVLSFYALAVYNRPEISGLSSYRLFGPFFRFPDFLLSAAVIALTAGLYYMVHRCDSHHRHAEMLLRRLYGERRWSLAMTLVAETFLLTGAAVVAGLVLIDIAYYYFKIPAEGWKIYMPGLLAQSAMMGVASGVVVAWHTCRHSITALLEKLGEQQAIHSRDQGARI
jgi:hypothetical protein